MMNETQVAALADKITDIVRSVDTDFRGDLFAHVAKQMRMHANGFTGETFEIAARRHGLNKFKE